MMKTRKASNSSHVNQTHFTTLKWQLHTYYIIYCNFVFAASFHIKFLDSLE